MATTTAAKKPAKKSTAKKKPAAASSAGPSSSSSAAGSSSSSSSSTPKWPAKGYSGPEPWELAAEHGDPVKLGEPYPEPYDGPGAVTHSKPLLTEGSAGPDVLELAQRLAKLGYRDNSITRGENHSLMLDVSVMASVRTFQADYNVSEPLAAFAGSYVAPQTQVDRHVGPYTWQALIALTD